MRAFAAQMALVLALAGSSCATFSAPAPFDAAALRVRAVTQTQEGVVASAALLLPEEVESIFGLPLLDKGIRPLWLELTNGTDQTIHFLVSGLDPEYYAPLEVAHAFHSAFDGESAARIDAHVSALAFESRAPIPPGGTSSGFVFLTPGPGIQVVDVDVLGDEWSGNLTLFVPAPSDSETARLVERIETRFSPPELVAIESPTELRHSVEQLPCCAVGADGAHRVPLNLVLVGELDQWVSGLQRRDYRYREAPPLQVFQRPQDVAAGRHARWVEAQSHTIRMWQTPLRYGSKPVWLGQVSMPVGGRFARDPDSTDPECDGVRDDLVADLAYCQGLAEIGFARGSGCPEAAQAGVRTDGLRAVLIFEDRVFGLDEIGFLGWELASGSR
jgi:hypothetical protein